MKKIVSMLLACVMLLGLCACGGSQNTPETTAPAAEAGLQVGFGRTNITPSYSVALQGGNYKNRMSQGVLDALFATCIAIKSGEEIVLLYTIDVKLMTGSFVAPMKSMISMTTGVPENNIFLSATHTHSGPAVRYSWDGSDRYLREFNDNVVGAAVMAIKDLAAATMSAGGVMTEGLNFVRHYVMSDGSVGGPNFGKDGLLRMSHVRDADRELQLVRFERADKKDILMMGFGAHCTMNGQETDLLLSADYPAPTREHIENNNPDMLVAFFQGASGDQVPSSSVEESFNEQYREHGKKLGQYALDALDTLKPVEGEGIAFANQTMTYATNKKDLDKTDNFNGRFEEKWIQTRKKLPPTRDMVLRAVTVGNLGFVFAPYEMFGEQGRYIKDNSPLDLTFIATCGEGDNSYLAASKGGFDYNSYEAQVCYYAEGVAEQAAKAFVDILSALRK
jgi:hypothetical protein